MALKRPTRIGAIIPDIVRQAEQQQDALTAVRKQWEHLVGRRFAAHAKPVSLRRGRLVVDVDRPGDSYTLSFERERLLKRLGELTGGRVTELVLRPGGTPRG